MSMSFPPFSGEHHMKPYKLRRVLQHKCFLTSKHVPAELFAPGTRGALDCYMIPVYPLKIWKCQ